MSLGPQVSFQMKLTTKRENSSVFPHLVTAGDECCVRTLPPSPTPAAGRVMTSPSYLLIGDCEEEMNNQSTMKQF